MEPTKVEYYDLGVVCSRIWMRDGVLHRSDGPSYIGYYPDGKILQESWYFEGKIHRSISPSWIEYKKDGRVDRLFFYNQGNDISRDVKLYLRENEIIDPMNIPFEHQLIMKMKFW